MSASEIRQLLAKDQQPKYCAAITPKAFGWGYEIEIRIIRATGHYLPWKRSKARTWVKAERKARRMMADFMAEDRAELEALSRQRVIEP